MTEEQRKKLMEDAEVADALFVLATEGYAYTEEVSVVGKDGKVEVVALRKHVPPSVEAQIFWLTNRQPGKWKIGDEAMAVILGKVDEQLEQYFQYQVH